jgi:hypothetical protein
VRPNGVYALRHEYIRKGVRDMFHAYEGVLRVVYHRAFWFRDDGSVLYAMVPGGAADAVRELRKERSANVSRGWYRLEGRVLKTEVTGANNCMTRWSCEVVSADGGSCNRLLVLSLLLLEAGADAGAATPLTSVEGEEFMFRHVPAMA